TALVPGPHTLTRGGGGGAKAHEIDAATRAPPQPRHEILARDAFHQGSLLKGITELRFENAVNAPHLLLFAKLKTVALKFCLAILAMLARNEVALFDSAFFAMAAFAF